MALRTGHWGIAAAVAVALVACGAALPAGQQLEASRQTGFIDSTGVRLSYQLDVPAHRGKVPAVVIGHGSGEVTKAQCRYYSVQFQARGFATLCYDKRGVG